VRPATSLRASVLGIALALALIPAAATATHVFSDVGHDAVHAPGIDYLAASGITAGCTPTTFCPGDDLTRAQMGTFLHRASGNAPGTPPSVNAAQLAGDGPSAYTSSLHPAHISTTSLAGHTSPESSALTARIEDLAAGTYLLTGRIRVTSFGTSATVRCDTYLDGAYASLDLVTGPLGSAPGYVGVVSLPIHAAIVLPDAGSTVDVRCFALSVVGLAPATVANGTGVHAVRLGDAG
jgi:hypothetical protein